jgi:outer membrane protein assembly factor BamB
MGWKPRKGLAHREIDGTVYIVDAAGSRLHRLNATGSSIWKSLAAGGTPRDAAASLLAEFEVGEAEASADTESFVRELGKAGLLEER